MMPEPKYHTTHDALKGYFVELFKGDVGRAAVRSVYPEKPYPCAVEQYCEDGCFKDMIEEYIDLLARGVWQNGCRYGQEPYAAPPDFGSPVRSYM